MSLVQSREAVRENGRVLAAGRGNADLFSSLEQVVVNDRPMHFVFEARKEALFARHVARLGATDDCLGNRAIIARGHESSGYHFSGGMNFRSNFRRRRAGAALYITVGGRFLSAPAAMPAHLSDLVKLLGVFASVCPRRASCMRSPSLAQPRTHP